MVTGSDDSGMNLNRFVPAFSPVGHNKAAFLPVEKRQNTDIVDMGSSASSRRVSSLEPCLEQDAFSLLLHLSRYRQTAALASRQT